MKKIYLFLIILPCLVWSCNDNWDNYYTPKVEDGDESSPTQNLLGFLEGHSQYSKFVELLKETKVDQELSRNQVLTVWAPVNDNMPASIEDMSLEDKKTLCLNHINYIALYNTKLENDKVVKTLAGKNLIIKEPTMDEFTIDEVKVAKLNEKCTNGVIHEITEWMLPRMNIYEFLDKSGERFSMVRDSIFQLNDTVFKPSLSFPLDVDELGNTIYDSVFVIENPILSKIDFRDEDNDYTLFLPSNQTVNNMYDYMKEYYEGVGKVLRQDDSVKFFSWMLEATMFKGKIENSQGSHMSVYNREWKGDKQQISNERQVCSNGYIYEVENIYIPKFLYLEGITSYAYYIDILPEGYNKEDHYKVVNGTISASDWQYIDGSYPGRPIVWAKSTGSDMTFEFDTFVKDYLGNVQEGKIMPGLYKISASFRAWAAGRVSIYINDEELVSNINAAASTWNFTKGLLAEEFEIKEEAGYNMVRIKLLDYNNNGRLTPEYFVFEPTENNY